MLSITHKLAPPSSVLLLVESLGDDLSIVRDARTRQRTDDRGRSAEGSSGQSGNHGGIREAQAETRDWIKYAFDYFKLAS